MLQRIFLIFVILSIMILTLIHLYFWIRLIYCGDSISYTMNDKPVIAINPPHEQVIVQKQTIVEPSIIATPPLIPTYPIRDYIKHYDRKKLHDDLESPEMRPDMYLIENGLPFDRYYTRGYPDSYRWMGLLICHDDTIIKNKIIKFFGHQRFPRSSEYEYYVIIHEDHDEIKIRLHKKRELYDDDEVIIPELGHQIYKVKLNKIEDSQYIF